MHTLLMTKKSVFAVFIQIKYPSITIIATILKPILRIYERGDTFHKPSEAFQPSRNGKCNGVRSIII